MSKYFFDTYAFFEIINGNSKYKPYSESSFITTIFNLAELSYNLKKEMNSNKADEIVKKYSVGAAKVLLEDLKEATNLKIKDKDLSLSDVIGYVVAKRHKVKFLTGDQGFENLDNVEFVKK